jgi:ligand-binding sensor domain-containing protein
MEHITIFLFITSMMLHAACADIKNVQYVTKQDKKSLTSISDTLKFKSGIRAILQDSKGNYWFGSHNEGVCLYNGISFVYFTTNEGVANNQIRSIQEDRYGKIWFGTAKGVSVYNEGKFTNYHSNNSNPKFDWNETYGDLWFNAVEDDGVYRFDGISMNYLIFPKPENDRLNTSYGVTGISKGKDGTVWIATYASLFRYDGTMTNVIDHKSLNLKDDEDLHIRSVLADSKGRIWIGNNGIGVILMEGESITHFSKEQGKLMSKYAFESNTKEHQFAKNTGLQSVFAIKEDSKGNIWFGDRDTGAWRFDGKDLKNFVLDSALHIQHIWDIFEDRNGNVLFASGDRGVYKFNGKGFDRVF